MNSRTFSKGAIGLIITAALFQAGSTPLHAEIQAGSTPLHAEIYHDQDLYHAGNPYFIIDHDLLIGKIAKTSSRSDKWDNGCILDKNRGTGWVRTGIYSFHTGFDSPAWWMVDLGDYHPPDAPSEDASDMLMSHSVATEAKKQTLSPLGYIVIYNRVRDCCWDRLDGLTVWINRKPNASVTDPKWTKVYTHTGSGGTTEMPQPEHIGGWKGPGDDHPLVIRLPAGTMARCIKLQQAKENTPMQLDGVEVYAPEPDN